jgi:hypothetical protein
MHPAVSPHSRQNARAPISDKAYAAAPTITESNRTQLHLPVRPANAVFMPSRYWPRQADRYYALPRTARAQRAVELLTSSIPRSLREGLTAYEPHSEEDEAPASKADAHVKDEAHETSIGCIGSYGRALMETYQAAQGQ